MFYYDHNPDRLPLLLVQKRRRRGMLFSLLVFFSIFFANDNAIVVTGMSVQQGGTTTGGGTGGGGPAALPSVDAAVIVPGFLAGQSEFEPLAKSLTKRGIPTVVVPMPVWHWIPCIGGRSIRPILERVDYTVRHLSASLVTEDGSSSGSSSNSMKINIPPFRYGLGDCWDDFVHNPGGIYRVGGSDVVEEYPAGVTPRGKFPVPPSPPRARVALIGHSAGGFISRAFLSHRPYGGKAYRGTELVHSLVTLGTPHGNAEGPAFQTVGWCNREDPAFFKKHDVRVLLLGSTGSPAESSGALTQGSYQFCYAGNEENIDESDLDGDGLTTIRSSMALNGDNVHKQILNGVTHYPWSDAGIWGDLVAPDLTKEHRTGEKPWYGDEPIIDQWVDFLVSSS